MKSIFIGSKKIGYNVIKTIYMIASDSLSAVITIDDRQDDRSYFNEIIGFCDKKHITVHIATDRSHSESLMSIEAADLYVVVGWYWMISKSLVEAARFIGIHNSLLPEYRGCAPLVWAMINGEKEVGTSLFSFTANMDDGNIWCQKKYTVNPEDYIMDVLDAMEHFAIDMIEENYLDILHDFINSKPQSIEKVTYSGRRTPEDGLINWNQPAEKVYNFIRAQSNPYPGAFTIYKGAQIKIFQAKLLDYTYFGTPGQILEPNIVSCGNNTALLLENTNLCSSKIRLGNYVQS